MIRPLTRREHELVLVALGRWADVERSGGNVVVAGVFDEIARAIERQPLKLSDRKEIA